MTPPQKRKKKKPSQPITGVSQIWWVTYFYMACDLRIVFIFLKSQERRRGRAETICGPHSLKFVFAPLHKMLHLGHRFKNPYELYHCRHLVAKPCPTLATPWTVARQAPLSMGFSRQEYWVGCHFLLQGIFPTQELNLGLLHCRQILFYWLS